MPPVDSPAFGIWAIACFIGLAVLFFGYVLCRAASWDAPTQDKGNRYDEHD